MAIGTPIGGIRVDLTLNSAAFIRDIAKTNAAIAGSTRQMTSQLDKLKKTASQVGAAFGAWITVRAAKQVINFLDNSIELAAKLHSELGQSAKQFQNNAEAMSNAFKLGIAQGFIDVLSTGTTDVTKQLNQLAEAGALAGRTLGFAFKFVVDTFTILLPEALRLAAQGFNILIGLINKAIGAFNTMNESFNDSWLGKKLGFAGGEGNLAIIPTIDIENIFAAGAALLGLGNNANIANDALRLTTEGMRMASRAGEEFSRIADLNRQLYDQIRTPMEAYEAQLSKISAAQLDAASTAKLQSMAQAELANTWLGAASAVSGALTSMFKENKAVAIANAVINTAEAISAALKNPPGPPFSFVYAAAAAAAGAAQIAAIASASPGNAKAPKVKGGGGGKVQKAVTDTSTSSGGGVPGQAVNITLVGEGGFSREQVRVLIGQINSAVGDGATLRVSG